MNEFSKSQKELAIQSLQALQNMYINYNVKEAKEEIAVCGVIGALEIAIQTLKEVVSSSGETNANSIRSMTDETDRVRRLELALLSMVYQYCTVDDANGDYLSHQWMEAGEEAFDLLGIKNFSAAEDVWNRIEETKAALGGDGDGNEGI